MSTIKKAPLCVFIANILIPEDVLSKVGLAQRQETFASLPRGLATTLARSSKSAPYHCTDQLDRVEAWLLDHLDEGEVRLVFETYPPWAMLTSDLNQAVKPFTRWWGSVGNLQLTRDGVSFTPPEVLQISASDLQAYWAILTPLLTKHAWSLVQTSSVGLACHQLLQSETPLPMEQASPWSVQSIRLTDYLPMDEHCSDWRRMWHEIQMALHDAPFNVERESQGLLPLNALWFWGGGEVWKTDVVLPKIYLVSKDGVFPAVKLTDLADEVVNRFVFWSQLLSTLLAVNEDEKPTRSSVYCVAFEGWGGKTAAFDVLEDDVVKPMTLAGLSFEWALLGESGWRVLNTDWFGRLLFWRRSPNFELLAEPNNDLAPTEEALKASWQAAQRDQDQIEKQWNQS